MSNPLIDDSQESRGVTADGTPLGVQARLSLSYDETLSEDVASGAEVWQRVLQAIKGGRVHAEVTLYLDDGLNVEAGNRKNAETGNGYGTEVAESVIVGALRFADVPVGLGPTADDGGKDNANGEAGGSAAPTKASLAGAAIADRQRRNEADRKRVEEQDATDDVYAVPRRAIIAMRSKMDDAEKRFRSVIVSLDAVPGNQVEGISPLYHVMGVDSSDASAAVIQLTTKLKPQAIVALLDSLTASHEGAITLRLVDVEGETMGLQNVTQGVADNTVDDAVGNAADNGTNQGAENIVGNIARAMELPLAEAKTQAEILAPWLDMDPDARLDGDPVSFLLAMAPDAARVGKVDDRWILGETR